MASPNLLLPLHAPKIRRIVAETAPKDFNTFTHVAMMLAAEQSLPKTLASRETINARMSRGGYKLGNATPFVTDLPNPTGTRLSAAGLKADATAFDRLTLACKIVAPLLDERPKRIVLAAPNLDGERAATALEALLAAVLAADFALPNFKSETNADKHRGVEEVVLYGQVPDELVARATASARGNNLARYLTALPANQLTPAAYRAAVEGLAKEQRWRADFLDLKRLRRLGAGAFIAVAQGSPDDDAGILRLRYTPRGKTKASPLALVGKGICFDTGGTNLKSAKSMHGAHEDMEGSAVALGALLALTALEADFPIDCWLALAQNHIGPKSYHPNQVIAAANGTTIEVVHTDAEGRMVLADTLHLAAREQPRLIIDYATLTGACIFALGTRFSGVITNRDDWIPGLIDTGVASGERVWPFPLPHDYEVLLKSDVADVKQCTIESEADQILAGLFLRRFVPNDIPWVHLDLAAGNHKGGLAHIPTDVTGFGVRFTLKLLLDKNILS